MLGAVILPKLNHVLKPCNVRLIYHSSRIGNREVVGFGKNGNAVYQDSSMFPFPAIRFMETTPEIEALRKKEEGDWKCLSCEEKKALYRASFCQTFSEFQAPTGTWKFVMGWVFIATSFAFWMQIFMHFFVHEPFPEHVTNLENQQKQLRHMLDIRTNPIDGLSSHWDYVLDQWK